MALNKDEKARGIRQYHIHLGPGDVGRYVLLPGDPDRANTVASYLDDAQLIAEHREHRTFTGYYKGLKISVTSTGMGCPSTAITAEELYNIGAECLIRIGSTGALQNYINIGDLIISTGSMKNEGTSQFYVPQNFPAVPDFDFTRVLIDTAERLQKELDFTYYYGLNSTDDAFYGESQEWIKKLSDLGLLNVEMESSALYTVAHRRGKKAAMISAVAGNLIRGEVIYDQVNERLMAGIEKEIKVVLEAIKKYHDEKGAGD